MNFVCFTDDFLGWRVDDMAVATQGGGEGSNDLLFKNITQILDLLLKDYDNSQHPNYQEGEFLSFVFICTSEN